MNNENDKLNEAATNSISEETSTPANLNASPSQSPDKWEMPEPVFRVSEGTKFNAKLNENEQKSSDNSPPHNDFSPAEPNSQFQTPAAQIQPQNVVPPKKSSNVSLVFGGIGVLIFLTITALLAVYFFFLRK